MEHDARRLSDFARILLIAAVLVTAVATHFIDTRGVFKVEDLTANEMSETLVWLDQFYRSPEGLQRPTGLMTNGAIDIEAISNWLFRDYLQARFGGSTPEEARDIVARRIEKSDEWRQKH